VTHLRRAMLEELQRRNYAKTTVYYYLKAVERFVRFFHTSPDRPSQVSWPCPRCGAPMRLVKRLTPRQIFLEVLLADTGYDSS
jgi:hypothetical protein